MWLVGCSFVSWTPAAELIMLLTLSLMITLDLHTAFSFTHSLLC